MEANKALGQVLTFAKANCALYFFLIWNPGVVLQLNYVRLGSSLREGNLSVGSHATCSMQLLLVTGT